MRYRGNGRGGKPILLLAHMDVVTAKPEEWQRDPFTLIEENGYFFGRGTLDNKQGVTVLTTTFLRLKRERLRADARSHHRVQRRRRDRHAHDDGPGHEAPRR